MSLYYSTGQFSPERFRILRWLTYICIMIKKPAVILTALLPVQIISLQILSYFPELVEQYYSNGIYPYISKALRFAFGWIPFSFGDVMYGMLIMLLVRYVIVRLFVKRKKLKWVLLEIGAGLSVIFAMFHLCWGFNYYRKPLHQILKLDEAYSQEELLVVSKALIQKANTLHAQLQPDDSLSVKVPYTKQEVFDKTIPAYQQLTQTFPNLEYTPRSIKKSLFSLLLTYMGFSGYLNPITNEGHINGLIINYKAPTTTCHEEAHQLGFAAENEANFIATLATIGYDDVYFQYSGITFALRYCLRELYAIDEQLGICHAEMLRPGVLKNYEEVIAFWRSYRNPLEPGFKSTYDTFLKANNQKKGIHSYRYVVALVVNYLKDEPEKLLGTL